MRQDVAVLPGRLDLKSDSSVIPERRLGREPLVLPVNPKVGALELLQPEGEYIWYSEANWKLALHSLRGIEAAEAGNRRDLAKLLKSAVLKLYHRDRAERARGALPGAPAPTTEIPSVRVIDHRDHTLRLQVLTAWEASMPDRALTSVSTLLEEIIPDQLLLATYVRPALPRPDPVIYAKFGDYFVKVAEWR